jgi:hypothetical protein
MGAGLLAVKSGFILFIKSYQFPLQINTLERERETEPAAGFENPCGHDTVSFHQDSFPNFTINTL